MNDHKIRAMAAGGTIRAFAVTGRDTVEEARQRHHLQPVVTAALGRTLMAASMMCDMEKDEDSLLTVQFLGDGPVGGITVTASPSGVLKGFANNPNVELPPKRPGKLDVGRAVGNGMLRVMRDTGAPDPYIGTVQLVSGEIAEDLTSYFARSEQVPSSVGLGVLVGTDSAVSEAGGFIVQLMPDVSDGSIDILENNIKNISSVTTMLQSGMGPEDMLGRLLDGLDLQITDSSPVSFCCDCSKERVRRSLISLNKEEIREIIQEGKPIETGCQFCGAKYKFTVPELRELCE